jgi:UDP-GlcNAc3NAcA epimerase
MKILTIVGARPQFVKAAVVSRAIADWNAARVSGLPALEELIVHTGQHFDANMSDVFFEEMEIPRPSHHLGIAGLSHGAMTGRMLEAFESVVQKERPDAVLTYGDTNSTLAGALAAVKMHVPVAHVEAGLRSFNMRMPEEVNRILTDRVSTWLYCPTETAVRNLATENLVDAPGTRLVLDVGDVMYDANLHYRNKARMPRFGSEMKLAPESFLLLTLHRQENTDDPARVASIVSALRELCARTPVVFPVHPRTRKILQDRADMPREGLHLVDPVPFFEMLWLLKNCALVLTDSGGVQKEAYFCDKHCVTLRDETEWVETVDAGANVLVGADTEAIVSRVRERLGAPFRAREGLYGLGDAGRRVVASLAESR